MIYDFRFMIYESPLDRGDLLDADGNKGDFAESRSVKDKDTARLQHLKIGHAELVIAIPTLLFVPDNDTSAGMDAFNGLTFQDRSVARRMETMVVKDIEDDMRRLTAGKGIPIRAIAEQIQPVSDRRGLDGRERDLAIARGEEIS